MFSGDAAEKITEGPQIAECLALLRCIGVGLAALLAFLADRQRRAGLRRDLFLNSCGVRVGVLDLLVGEILAEFGRFVALLAFEIVVAVARLDVQRFGFLIEAVLPDALGGEGVVARAVDLALGDRIRNGGSPGKRDACNRDRITNCNILRLQAPVAVATFDLS